MKKFLTGITVCFNSSEVIINLINSIRKILNNEIEWIIVDSGSKDKTPSILKKIKNVKIFLFKKNIGFSKGNNFAFKFSMGEYVFFCNPDISFDKSNFERIINELKKYKPLILVPLLRKDDKYYYFLRALPSIENILRFRWHKGIIKKVEKIQPAFSAIFLKREVFEKLFGFDEKFFVYFTDVEFFKRFYNKGFKVKDIYFSKNYFSHKGSSILLSRKNEFLKKFDFARGFLIYFLKYGNLIEKNFSIFLFIFLLLRAFYYYFK
ncbi:MAG: glycosyltransferase [candidate division WOR-3 bacterium]